ncbi:MAG: type I restriction-modification system subunit M [Brevinema sp.]
MTTQETINNKLLDACDTFRGIIDAEQFKNYILTMLFLKYISDAWKEHYAEYAQKYGDNDEMILRRMKSERFVIPKGFLFDDLYKARHDDNIGQKIDEALQKIESSNSSKLDNNILTRQSFNTEQLGSQTEKNRRLSQILVDFNSLDLRPSQVSGDIIGESYIYLISEFASGAGKKAGEFFTPLSISKLLAELSGVKEGLTICDPACGSGSLLLRTARMAKSSNHNYALFGMEVNGSTYALAKMNMFLHGEDDADIRWCNSLTDPQLLENDKLMQFDILVANPPFSLDKWWFPKDTASKTIPSDRHHRFDWGMPPQSKGDWAFILTMLAMCKEKSGRVAVIVPHGVLFRGSSEGKIREEVIKSNYLDAVIGLPPNLFQSTGIPVAILVFDKGRTREDVMFIDASQEFTPQKNQNLLEDAHIARIAEAYKTRKDVERFSRAVPVSEIEDNGCNWNIPRYVDTYEEEAPIDLEQVKKELDIVDKELKEAEAKLKDLLKDVL